MEKRLKCYVAACTFLILAAFTKGGVENWFFWFISILCLIMLWFSVKK